MVEEKSLRYNNFNILRFFAAMMVMVGHMAYIDGSNNIPIVWGQGIQTLGVKIFFLIGGFLIAKSWLSDPHFVRYWIKRIVRIFPPLIIYVLLAVFVFGPMLSNLTVGEYFKNVKTYGYLLNILMFPIYNLPGVFENNPYPNAVNGSLWTLPVEIAMYIAVPIIISLCNRKNKLLLKTCLVFVVTICLFQILHLRMFPSWRLIIWGTDLGQAFALIPYYFLGILFSFEEMRKLLNLQRAIILTICFFGLSPFLTPVLNELLTFIIFPYFVFSFALAPEPQFDKFMNKYEVSYGVYLYGFFVQQVVVFVFGKMNRSLGTISYFMISLLLTGILATLSYKFVESPLLAFSKKILKKIS